MENSWIIFQKLLVLFGFMLLGTFSYKRRWLSDDGASQISRLIVNIQSGADYHRHYIIRWKLLLVIGDDKHSAGGDLVCFSGSGQSPVCSCPQD